MDETKKRRMSGLALRAAARLMESRGTGAVLYPLAIRQLGLLKLREATIPSEIVPYRPLHLGAAGSKDDLHD